MSVPFHKQTDPNKQAGQVVFQDHKQETTLAQYIKRKEEGPQRITFDEWCNDMGYQHPSYGITISKTSYLMMQAAWNAALTKGKL